MSGNDVFVLMPTGGGKSLTYQVTRHVCMNSCPYQIFDQLTVCPVRLHHLVC
jgi:hypothetical protein